MNYFIILHGIIAINYHKLRYYFIILSAKVILL